MTTRTLVALAALALTGAGDGFAQSWYREQPATAPSARRFHGMAYDSARAVAVLFGGTDERSAAVFGDTWEFDGADWSLRTLLGPPARQRFASCFDRARGMFTIFGGVDANGGPLAETWRWDGKAWMLVPTAHAPSPRLDARMVFDAARGRVVLFGGRPLDASQPFGDTWEFDGSDWMQRAPATSPEPRFGHAMTYDSARRTAVLFGGFTGSASTSTDTWEYDGMTWRRIVTTTTPAAAVFPSLAFHSGHGVAVLTGGSGNATQALSAFVFDGVDWQAGPAAPAELVSRQGHATAFDEAREGLVLFGGASVSRGGALPFADTWELSAQAAFLPFGSSCATSAGQPMLGSIAGARPQLGHELGLEVGPLPARALPLLLLGASSTSWNTIPLPLDLGRFGLRSCQLFVSADAILAMMPSGTTARSTLRIPLDRRLLEREVFVQALLLGGELATSNAGRLVGN